MSNQAKIREMLKNKSMKDVRSLYGTNNQPRVDGIERLSIDIENSLPFGSGIKDICEVEVDRHQMSHKDRILEEQRQEMVNELMINGEPIPQELQNPIVGRINPVIEFQEKAIRYFGKATYKTSKAEMESKRTEFERIQTQIDAKRRSMEAEKIELEANLKRYWNSMTFQERHQIQERIYNLDSITKGISKDDEITKLEKKAGEIMEQYTLAKAYVKNFEFENADLIAEVEREKLKNQIR